MHVLVFGFRMGSAYRAARRARESGDPAWRDRRRLGPDENVATAFRSLLERGYGRRACRTLHEQVPERVALLERDAFAGPPQSEDREGPDDRHRADRPNA